MKKIYVYTYIYLVSVAYRFFWLFIANQEISPFSDFKHTWALANGDMSNISYRSLFASWMNFANLESIFVDLFGNNYRAFLVLNVFVSSISVIAVYGIMSIVIETNNKWKNIPFIGALLYAIYPSSAIFMLNASPDVYVVPLYLISIYLLLIGDEFNENQPFHSVVLSLGAGVFCGISAGFKSFGVVVIVAYCMVGILQFINKKITIKKFGILMVSVLCLLISYSVVKESMLKQTEKKFDVDLNYRTALAHYLLVGLNTEGEGQMHVGNISTSFIENVLNEGMPIDEAAAESKKILVNDWKNNSKRVFPLFVKKLIWAWQDDVIPIMYLSHNNANDTNILGGKYLMRILPSIAQMFYLMIMFLSFIGAIEIIKVYSSNSKVIFLNLIILGYCCVVLLSEAQSRYKYIIMPLICGIASVGVQSVLDGFTWISKHRKNDKKI